MFQHEERIQPDRYFKEHYSTFANYLGRYIFASRFVGPNAAVLDLGCGYGYGSAHLAEAPGRTVIGIDRSMEALDYAKHRYQTGPSGFIRAGASALPVKSDSLDAAIGLEMIEHVADAEGVVREVRRVLKEDGVFVVSTPNRRVTGSGETPANPFHVREYTPDEFVSLLQHGFSRVALYGEGVSAAFSEYQENMARIWRNLSLLHDQVDALRSRLEMDEQFTGVSLLRRLKRLLVGGAARTVTVWPAVHSWTVGPEPYWRLGRYALCH